MVSASQKRVVELVSAGGQKGLTKDFQRPVYFTDGRVVLVREDGTSLAIYPDGHMVEDLLDGTIRQVWS